MTANRCVRCDAPMPDSAYICARESAEMAEKLLVAAGHAEDAETVIARQARLGAGSRGGSSDGLNYDATRAARFEAVKLAIGGWARIVTAETGRGPRWRALAGPLCPPRREGGPCGHGSCEAIRRKTPPPALARECAWLSTQTGFLRKHPAADEAFRELHDACKDLVRLIDAPADKELVGMCDCGKVLYAPHGRRIVICPEKTCERDWHVERSREILRKALDEKLLTAAEAARLAQYLDTDRTQEQIRKLINGWARATRRLIVAHGEIDGEPTFRFGDIAGRLARTPRRTPRAGVAA